MIALSAGLLLLVLAGRLDMRRFEASLLRMNAWLEGRAELSLRPPALTSAGTRVGLRLEGLRHSLAIRRVLSDEDRSRDDRSAIGPIPARYCSHDAEGAFYATLLRSLPNEPRFDCAAMIFTPLSDPGRRRVVCLGCDDARLEARLTHASGSWRGAPPWLLDSGSDWLSDLSAFGLRYGVAAPVKLSSLRDGAVLWLGFRDGTPPACGDIARFQAAVSMLESRFSSWHQALSLSESVRRGERNGELLKHLSHDMRSPLANIKAILHLLSGETEDREKAETMEAARANCEALEDLLSDLSHHSRHHSGDLEVRPERVGLCEAARRARARHVPAARAKGLEIALDLPDENLSTHADPTHVERILSNLLSNAVKYSCEGEIAFSLRKSGGGIVVTVADRGAGFTPAQASQLFEPYARLRPDLAPGLGLGLHLSRILARRNGGEITAAARPGGGSEFTLTLPLCEPALVLVADDDLQCATSLGKLVAAEGYRVRCVASLAELAEACRSESPRALITDYCMPGGGAARVLGLLDELGLVYPVLVVSGYETSEISLPQARAGLGYLQKPVDRDQLRAWLSGIGGSRNPGDAAPPIATEIREGGVGAGAEDRAQSYSDGPIGSR